MHLNSIFPSIYQIYIPMPWKDFIPTLKTWSKPNKKQQAAVKEKTLRLISVSLG